MHKVFALIVALGLLAACQSPWERLAPGTSASGQAPRLVVHMVPAAKAVDYGVGDAGYLTVRLTPEGGGAPRFAASSVTDGSAALDLFGLAPGPYSVEVRLFDWDGASRGTAWSGSADRTQPQLLFLAKDSVTFRSGEATDASLWLYPAGSLSSSGEAVAPTVSISVLDDQGRTSGSARTGVPLQLFASALTASGSGALGGVVWTVDRPDLADVSKTGLVVGKELGTVTVTATSKESSGVSGSYTLQVEPGYLGYWRNQESTTSVYQWYHFYRSSTNVLMWELTQNVGGTQVSKQRGPVSFTVPVSYSYTPLPASAVYLYTTEFLDLSATVPGWSNKPMVASNQRGGISLGNWVAAVLDESDQIAVNPLSYSHPIFHRTAFVPTTSVSLAMTAPGQFTATVTPANASIPHVAWGSLDPTIGRVDANGTVGPLTAGAARYQVISLDDLSITATSAPITVGQINLDFAHQTGDAGDNAYDAKQHTGVVNASDPPATYIATTATQAWATTVTYVTLPAGTYRIGKVSGQNDANDSPAIYLWNYDANQNLATLVPQSTISAWSTFYNLTPVNSTFTLTAPTNVYVAQSNSYYWYASHVAFSLFFIP